MKTKISHQIIDMDNNNNNKALQSQTSSGCSNTVDNKSNQILRLETAYLSILGPWLEATSLNNRWSNNLWSYEWCETLLWDLSNTPIYKGHLQQNSFILQVVELWTTNLRKPVQTFCRKEQDQSGHLLISGLRTIRQNN